MSCKYSLLFLLFSGFAVLSVSTKTCEKGTSCTIKLPTQNIPNEITWTHLSGGDLISRKNGKIKINTLKGTIEEDGSLTFKSVSLKNTGKYKYSFYASDGTETSGQVEMKVYANLPKPTVMFHCQPNGSAHLTCGIPYSDDLTISWYNGKQIINDTSEKQLFLTPAQKQENKLYSCHAKNPISEEQSESITLSCPAGEGSGARKLFGFDFWTLVSILSGGGALLLLLICVLVICVCRSCSQQKKHQQDEEELRLRVFQDEAPNGTARSKHTARGQPAPPIPQEDLSPQTPTQTQTQPKAQTRARPPPPPEDNEEYPPSLPRPRNKQHRKRNEEPYRPME
ncbi:hepatocyte cell adhesion molecule-like [Cyprinus carpio]|uniref:Hepatocyte cell adhesion molecule-like n=1 Tax=Cyprinus carpio TaxID=7962 RepID=A0A9R0AKI7_CYPCA|nr:hepatocyte cell adhesion molecule-like [Cyprinus carpio]